MNGITKANGGKWQREDGVSKFDEGKVSAEDLNHPAKVGG